MSSVSAYGSGDAWALGGHRARPSYELITARHAVSDGLAALRASLGMLLRLSADLETGQVDRTEVDPVVRPAQTRPRPRSHSTTVIPRPGGRGSPPPRSSGRGGIPTQSPERDGSSTPGTTQAPVSPDAITEIIDMSGVRYAPTPAPERPDPTDAAAEVWALVERAQAGEAEAFGLIYDRYLDTVFRFIYFRVGHRQLAEDLTSDTFLRALKRIGSFTWQGRDLGAWLVTIARNLVADHFKSGRYRLEVTSGDVLEADGVDRGIEGSPESAVVDHITNVTLLTAVKQLNREQQECIVLRFLQGFSVAETAQAMGKNEGAIKALQYRAVRALNRLLPDGFQT
jgi:RNA polymerase sigma-70 factor, ECF subfamily